MKAVLIFAVGIMLVLAGCGTERAPAPVASQDSEGANTGAEAEFDALLSQIQNCDEQGGDLPEAVYDRYFELEEQLHPEFYESASRGPIIVLDELADTCPGTLVEGPDFGVMNYSVCGQTYTANNNCSYPDCRYGRDVVVQLNVYGNDNLLITTTGSRFDTYLCLYVDGCCGEEGMDVLERNNNAPDLCNGQFLAAGIERCVFPGTHYIVLDGAGPAARGSYCLNITLSSNECY